MAHYSPSQLAGGLYGLLIGDALGVPYEFHEPEDLPAHDLLEYEPPRNFARTHRGTPPGTWSDDGALALCLLASLLDQEHFDAEDCAKRFLAWRESGYMAIDGRVFDIGITTSAALDRLRRGTLALQAGGSGEHTQSNGSLMRLLPLALWHRGDDATLARAAADQSRITHAHPTVRACCILYALWARRTLEGVSDSWSAAVTTMRELSPLGTAERQALDGIIQPDRDHPVEGTGFVVDTLRSARAVQALADNAPEQIYAATVRGAIALGHDTDTTACVAGGIAGIRCGIEGIPIAWRAGLRGREIVEPLLARLINWHAAI